MSVLKIRSKTRTQKRTGGKAARPKIWRPFRNVNLLVGGLLLLGGIATTTRATVHEGGEPAQTELKETVQPTPIRMPIGYRVLYDLSFKGNHAENALALTNTSRENSFCLIRKVSWRKDFDVRLVYDPVKDTYSENDKVVSHGDCNVVQVLFNGALDHALIGKDTTIVHEGVLTKVDVEKKDGTTVTTETRRDVLARYRKDGIIEACAKDGGNIVNKVHRIVMATDVINGEVIPDSIELYMRQRVPWLWEWNVSIGKLTARFNHIEWVYDWNKKALEE